MDKQATDVEIHTFDNGIKVFRRQLIQEQLERYQRHNLHEPEEEELFLEVFQGLGEQGGVYIDIGAAIGYYVMLAKRLAPDVEVHAFEPLEMHRQYLLENVALNEIPLNGIHLHEQAVSSKSGDTELFQHDYGSCLVEEKHLKLNGLPADRKIPVESITLDSFIKTLSRKVDLVQMDVQGFEFDVLAGAEETLRARKVRCWMVGTHSPQIHAACKQLLQMNQYRITVDQFDTLLQPDGILMAEA